MTSASLAVQRALFAAFAAESGLATLTGVYDAVPAEASAPYLTLGPDIVTDWSGKTAVGHEHRIQLAVWDSGPGMARAKTLLAAVETAVRALNGTVDGHRIASVLFLRSFVTKATDNWTQGTAEFRVRTEQL